VAALRAERPTLADERAANAAAQLSIKRSQWVIAGAAIASAIIAGAYTCTSSKQLSVMRKSVDVAIGGQRPWILLAGIEPIPPPVLNQESKIRVHLQNYGGTPALAVSVNTWVALFDRAITDEFVDRNRNVFDAKVKSLAVFAPRSVPDTTADVTSPVFEQKYWPEFQSDQRRLYVFGEIVYADGFSSTLDRSRRTRFCQFYEVKSGSWSWCSHFNSAN
jgi:hypothetical protein